MTELSQTPTPNPYYSGGNGEARLEESKILSRVTSEKPVAISQGYWGQRGWGKGRGLDFIGLV